ncbi:4'-phosphopantetheinyl transferase family protein [Chitinophaga sp. 30R24]|uniref:4'-phosphopantetheinyl transferase family protein n=1 Tax=Chitinophaga sp. 30R24 TaxID=3248838 RepID=UPI003B903890
MKEWTSNRVLPITVTRAERFFPVVMAVSALPLPSPDNFLHPEEEDNLTGAAEQQYLLGRHAAKLAAAHFTHIAPANIRITSGVFGQPVLYCPGYSNLQVSIAHSEEVSMAIVFPESHPMAVDIEAITNYSYIPPVTIQEADLMALLPYSGTEKQLLFWTAKEALSKVLKTGFTTDLSLFQIKTAIVENGALECTFTHFVQYKAICWIAGNIVCALVLPEKSQIDIIAVQALTSPAV